MLLALACALAMPAACAATRVLFVGNSLTYANQLPELVQAFARSAGVEVEVATRAEPDWSLQEHARSGVSMRKLGQGWDIIVLQQGPSASAQSRVQLAYWSEKLVARARRVGTPRIALYAPWPMRQRSGDFAAALASYASAARGAQACVLPVVRAWETALTAPDGPDLYARDGLHPTPDGSLLAAALIAQGLFGPDARAPERLRSGRMLSAQLRTWLDTTAASALNGAEPACISTTPPPMT